MSSVVQFYANSPMHNRFVVITGSANAIQIPASSSLLLRLKTRSGNIGSFFVGDRSNNCVFELDAGDDTGWVAINNTDQLWVCNPSGTSDYLSIWYQV